MFLNIWIILIYFYYTIITLINCIIQLCCKQVTSTFVVLGIDVTINSINLQTASTFIECNLLQFN